MNYPSATLRRDPVSLNMMDDDIRIENHNGQETYVFDPYNSLNKSIGESEVQQILKTYGIDVPIYNLNL